MLNDLPIGIEWLRAVSLAIAVLLGGLALYRVGFQRLVRRLLQSDPQAASQLLSKLAPTYMLALLVAAANMARGLCGSRVDWWLGALFIPVVVVLVIEFVRLGVVNYVLRIVGRRPVPAILRDIVFGVVYTTALLIYMGAVFKIDLAPFLTTSAILSVVIGMALQDTLGNLFAGLAINLDRPFDIGDWVSIDGMKGQVIEITWRATKIQTTRSEMHIIPNNSISKAQVINYQQPSSTYAEAVDIGLSYETPPKRAIQVLMDTAREVQGPDLPPPKVHLLTYGDSSIVYRVQLYLDSFGNSFGKRGQFQELAWYNLHRAGIEIPFPIRTVHMVDPARAAASVIAEHTRALKRIDVIACMDEDSIATLAAKARLAYFTRGERIFSQNDAGGSLYVIKHGAVTLSLDHTGGKDTRPFATLTEGQFFGEMSLLTGEPRTASAHAASECELLTIDQQILAPLLEAHPELLHLISRTIVERRIAIEQTRQDLAELSERVAQAGASKRAEADEASSELFNKIRSFFKLM